MKGGVTVPDFTVNPFASGSLKADGAQGVVFRCWSSGSFRAGPPTKQLTKNIQDYGTNSDFRDCLF